MMNNIQNWGRFFETRRMDPCGCFADVSKDTGGFRMNCPMSDDVLCGGDDGPPPKRIRYCPKCGLESDYRITNGIETYDICAFCGHEEKVKP